jgi:hypothetical protein
LKVTTPCFFMAVDLLHACWYYYVIHAYPTMSSLYPWIPLLPRVSGFMQEVFC